MQAITQAARKAAKVAIMVVRDTEGPTTSSRAAQAVPRLGWPALKHPTFHWKAQDNYNKLNNFKIEV